MEGSVFVDGYDTEVEETDEVTETPETEEEKSSEAPSKDNSQPEDNKEEKPEETFKGTKVDPNPQSAIHQELANTKRLVSQMSEVLNNPELLAQYMEKSGFKKQEPEAPSFTKDKVQSAEDVINALNEFDSKYKNMESDYKKEIEALKAEVGRITSGREMENRVSNLEKDATVLREKYPELKQGTPNYSPELENKVQEAYVKFGLDENGLPNGKVSLSQVADLIMSAAYAAKKKGSEEAQTIVKEKQLAKAVGSSPKAKDAPSESGSPDAIMAQRISSLFKK